MKGFFHNFEIVLLNILIISYVRQYIFFRPAEMASSFTPLLYIYTANKHWNRLEKSKKNDIHDVRKTAFKGKGKEIFRKKKVVLQNRTEEKKEKEKR